MPVDYLLLTTAVYMKL